MLGDAVRHQPCYAAIRLQRTAGDVRGQYQAGYADEHPAAAPRQPLLLQHLEHRPARAGPIAPWPARAGVSWRRRRPRPRLGGASPDGARAAGGWAPRKRRGWGPWTFAVPAPVWAPVGG